jgi:antitoxin component YwqK of YwqJK toxin-antitoxin module
MKNLLFVFILTANYSFSQWVFDNVPEPKIKENGKCIVYYEFNKYEYINNSNIIDWLKSARKITNTEPLKKDKIYLIEKFRQKESLKQGEFSVQLSKATNLSNGSLTLTPIMDVMSGQYNSDKLNGEVNIFTDYAKDLETTIKIIYSNGKIIDQEVAFNKQLISLKQNNITVNPKVIFKNGKVFESTYFVKGNWRYFFEKDKNTIFELNYTDDHIGREFFQEKLLECFYYKRDDSNDLEIKKVHIFDIKDRLFDTSNILASYSVVNNKLNGIVKIWNKNGDKTSQPIKIMNYRNNFLDGEYITFFEDGRVKEKYSFKDGYLNGKGEIYVSKIDNYDFILPEIVQNKGLKYHFEAIGIDNLNIKNAFDIINLFHLRTKSLIVPVALIMGHIGKNHNKNYNDSYYDVSGLEYFKFCDLEFEYNKNSESAIMKNYRIYVGNDKFFEREVQNCNNSCFNVFDKSQNIILSSEIMNEYQNKIQKQEDLKKENLLKKEIECNWCNKKIIVKDAIYLEECKCFDRLDKPTTIFLSKMVFFCSRKCASDSERQICRERGYK